MKKPNNPKQFIYWIHRLQILVVILVLPFLYNYMAIDKDAEKTFYIDASNAQSVTNSLSKHGYTLTFVDKWMLGLEQLPSTGWYTLEKKQYGRYTFFRTLYKHKAKTMKIVIFAAESREELLKRLANDVKLDRKKLEQAYKAQSPFKEAAIFAGHYTVARKVSEKALIQYLLLESKRILDFFIEKSFTHKPDKLDIKVLLTIASIIQKESNDIEEMPLISAVIYNRLKKKMKLQMDSTLNYGKYSHQIVTPERIKTDTSYYNTYKHKGLPPYPLGSISTDALRAAMFPADNKHIFFMLKPNGSHAFCETYEEHLCNIREFRAYQKRREEEKKRKIAAEKAAKEAAKRKIAEQKAQQEKQKRVDAQKKEKKKQLEKEKKRKAKEKAAKEKAEKDKRTLEKRDDGKRTKEKEEEEKLNVQQVNKEEKSQNIESDIDENNETKSSPDKNVSKV